VTGLPCYTDAQKEICFLCNRRLLNENFKSFLAEVFIREHINGIKINLGVDYMSKYRGKKKITGLLLFFAIVLVAGFTYAGTSGVLKFEGTARLATTPSADLYINFLSDTVGDVNGYGSIGTATVVDDGETAVLDVTFEGAGPDYSVNFTFTVDNEGFMDALLDNPVTSNAPELIITGNYPSMNGAVVPQQSNVGPYWVNVEWNPAYATSVGVDKTFTITVDWTEQP